MAQRTSHIIDGVDRGGKPHKEPEKVAAAIAEYEGEDLMEVDGHQITPLELALYRAASRPLRKGEEGHGGMRFLKDVCDEIGTSVDTLTRMKRKSWWKELDRVFVEDGLRDFQKDLIANRGVILEGALAVARGTDENDKTANARVQMAKALMEGGSNPFINRKPNIQITHNTQNNTLNLDPEKFRKMSRTELFEFARTGKRPQEVE